MRQKRAKAYKKQMNVYLHAFKFREPFQLIVDNEMVINCDQASYDIIKGFNRTIQAESKPMITQCCIQALYDTKNQRAIDTAKTFERRRCNHREAIDPHDCIESIVNIKGENKHRYVVATQNLPLRKKLRKIPGIPLIFMNRSVMVMEPMSDATAEYSRKYEEKKLTGGLNDAKRAGVINKEEEKPKEDKQTDGGEPPKKKRKGPKGPNPLSVKKKKTGPTEPVKEETKKSNRRRKHKKASANDEEAQDTPSTDKNEVREKEASQDVQEHSAEQRTEADDTQ
ncbi:uncharacterized protein J8A68_003664 [[Candida] subhashii]|uniref:U three protein 23 n=1 Tax=[Candida] subhashii TaxID=561895 RepID=A0A8J5UW92_9ASCO|nr:uncharacterized protein J8A68_003664 [[Candida] subhashii]KAG7662810.1 hypothetical protein J8A68_003664 [[Candida] subhashii]